MKVALLASCIGILLALARGDEDDVTEVYNNNNPLGLKADTTFYSSYGAKFQLYTTNGEIRNILVPPSEYLNSFDFYNPNAKKHPPVYFNLYKNGHNDGVYLLKNKTAVKIKDGTDTVADYPSAEDYLITPSVLIYISASDGIYTYNSATDAIAKFGSVTEDFKAIDKVSGKDEIYALAADNKIYKITAQGTVKTKVEGIEYAKDFVLDLLGAIYFLGEDNKPQVLYKDSTTPVKITGLNFDVKNAVLGRPLWDPMSGSDQNHTVPFIIDGVAYALVSKSVLAVPCHATVPDLTGFSAEYSFVNFYGEGGHLYMHALLADNPNVMLKRGSSNKRKVAFDRDVEADFRAFKSRRHRQKN